MKVFGCLGEKKGMTQFIKLNNNSQKRICPVTAISVSQNIVSQIKSQKNDGYNSIQLAFGSCSEKALNKPKLGHLQRDSLSIPSSRFLREIREMTVGELEEGDEIDISDFKEGSRVKIIARTKGKGFAGAIKKHGFSRGNMSHGAGYPHRQTGSICFGRGTGQKVIKGKKMPGRMGNRQVTKITFIEKIDLENKIIFVRGAVPGPRKGLIVLRQLIH